MAPLLSLLAKSAAGTAVVTQPQLQNPAITQPIVITNEPTIITDDKPIVKVRFYGESGCPDCGRFVVRHLGPDIITNEELMSFVDFDSIPFGNSYFGTDTCGKGGKDGKWNGKEANCWVKHCEKPLAIKDAKSGSSSDFLVPTTTPLSIQNFDPPNWCFEGEVLAQHGELEALFDVYQSCAEMVQPTPPAPPIDPGYSRNAYVFQWCSDGEVAALGPGASIKEAPKILEKCATMGGYGTQAFLDCAKEKTQDIEEKNAARTPIHNGVPFVVVDGKAVSDASKTKKAICAILKKKIPHKKDIPVACNWMDADENEEVENKEGDTMVV